MLKPSNEAKKNIEVLRVIIDGETWTEVPSFQSSQPYDTHYTVNRDSGGTLCVTFGDGKNGRRPPSDATKTISILSPDEASLEVSLKSTESQPTSDQALWVAIRNSSNAISFNRYERFVEEPKGGKNGSRCYLYIVAGLIVVLIAALIAWFVCQK